MAVGRDGKVLRNNEPKRYILVLNQPKKTKETHKADVFM